MSPARRAPVWPSRPRTERCREIDAAALGRRLARASAPCRRAHRPSCCDASRGSRCRTRRRASSRDPLDQRGEQIDAEAHIARLDDHGVSCRGRDLPRPRRRQAGGADDMDDAAPARRVRRSATVAAGHGEIDDARRPWRTAAAASVVDRDAVGAEPGELAGIAARSAADPAPRSRRRAPTPSVSAIALTSVRPMRPPAPTTISRMSDMIVSPRRDAAI